MQGVVFSAHNPLFPSGYRLVFALRVSRELPAPAVGVDTAARPRRATEVDKLIRDCRLIAPRFLKAVSRSMIVQHSLCLLHNTIAGRGPVPLAARLARLDRRKAQRTLWGAQDLGCCSSLGEQR